MHSDRLPTTDPSPCPSASHHPAVARHDAAARRVLPGWAPVAAGAAMVALRLPAFLADRHLTFDDGVFGASAVAMRDGGVPFRDVFSSQGPLFLPLVWIADVVGLRTLDAPRLLAVASGLAIFVLVFFVGRRLAGGRAGLLAAAVAASSGSVLWTSGPLAADGPGLALALGAVALALAYRSRPRPSLALAVGVVAGAAFTIKSLFAVPAGLAVAWVLLERRAWRDLGIGVGSAAAFVLAVSLPWGIADVWDQAVVYHLEAAGERTPGANMSKVVSTLWDRDVLLLGLTVPAAALALNRWGIRVARGEFFEITPTRWGGPVAPVGAWFVGVVLVFLFEHPLWRPHLAHVVPPLTILVVYAAREHLRFFTVLALLLAVGQVATTTDILLPDGRAGAAADASAVLERLPDDAWAISDDPGFVWRAGLRTPDDFVDTSVLRIDSGRITAESLVDAASDPRVCAVLVWSSRFARFDLAPRLAPVGYEIVAEYPRDRSLMTRASCPG